MIFLKMTSTECEPKDFTKCKPYGAGRDGPLAQRSTRLLYLLIMGNAARPGPTSNRPAYLLHTINSASSFHSLLQVNRTYPIQSTVLRRQTIQHSTPSFNSHQ
jgi:hypothetical protein